MARRHRRRPPETTGARAPAAARPRAADLLYAGSLLTLPLIGCDPVRLVGGVDVGAGFQPAYLLLAGATLLAVVTAGPQRLRAGWAAARPWSTLALLATGAVVVSALGLVISPPAAGPGAGARFLRLAKQLSQLLIMFVFVGWPLVWTRGAARWAWTRRLFGVALLGQLAYGLAQGLLFGRASPLFAAVERVFTANPAILSGSEELFLGRGFTGIPRLRGTCCEPLYLGNYLLLALPVMLLPGARRRHRLLALAGGVLLLLTWSRGAWLAAAGGAVVWALLARRVGCPPGGDRRPAPRPWGVAALVAGAALALVLWHPDLLWLPLRRLAQTVSREDWSNLTRVYSMQAAWRAFLASPVVGVGWGQFGFHFVTLVDPLGLQSQFTWPVVNSYPLEILCETGLLGFAVFVAGAVLVARAIRRATVGRGADGQGDVARRRVALLAAAAGGVWLQLLTFSQYNLPHIWVALGLLLAATREAEGARG
ncbi:MAG: O-antigen ligase family protein [Candidatus Krumholzibacteriia bacterium]